MENKFLTKEEISSLKSLSDKFETLKNTLGEIEVQRMGLDLSKKELESHLIELREEESTISNSLQEKYGEGSISLETGEFIPDK